MALRRVSTKCALYATIAHDLRHDPGVRPGTMFVNLVVVAPENGSFGDGLVQYGPPV